MRHAGSRVRCQSPGSSAYLTVFGSVIAFSCYMTLLARTSAVLASSYSFVTPVIGLFLGVKLGGETVTVYEWGAVAIIIIGVAILVLGRRERG